MKECTTEHHKGETGSGGGEATSTEDAGAGTCYNQHSSSPSN